MPILKIYNNVMVKAGITNGPKNLTYMRRTRAPTAKRGPMLVQSGPKRMKGGPS
jgi:hypothetical protein